MWHGWKLRVRTTLQRGDVSCWNIQEIHGTLIVGNPWDIDCGDTTWLIHAQALGADRNRQELNHSHIPTLLVQSGTSWYNLALFECFPGCPGNCTQPLLGARHRPAQVQGTRYSFLVALAIHTMYHAPGTRYHHVPGTRYQVPAGTDTSRVFCGCP